MEGVDEATRLNGLTERIIGAAMQVHSVLGPGLLESAYVAALAFELQSRGLTVELEKPLEMFYGDVKLQCAYRLDMLVDGSVIVEVKSLDQLAPVHKAQLLSYLRLARLRVGLLINFNVTRLLDGLQRVVNRFPDSPRNSPWRHAEPSADG